MTATVLAFFGALALGTFCGWWAGRLYERELRQPVVIPIRQWSIPQNRRPD